MFHIPFDMEQVANGKKLSYRCKFVRILFWQSISSPHGVTLTNVSYMEKFSLGLMSRCHFGFK